PPKLGGPPGMPPKLGGPPGMPPKLGGPPGMPPKLGGPPGMPPKLGGPPGMPPKLGGPPGMPPKLGGPPGMPPKLGGPPGMPPRMGGPPGMPPRMGGPPGMPPRMGGPPGMPPKLGGPPGMPPKLGGPPGMPPKLGGPPGMPPKLGGPPGMPPKLGGPPGMPPRMGGPPGMPPRMGGPPGMPPRMGGPPGMPPRMGGPPGMGRNYGTFKPALPEKENPKPELPMKKCRWTRISDRKIQGTIWEVIGKDDIEIDVEPLQSAFGTKVINAPVQTIVKKKQSTVVSLFDPNRQRDLAIALTNAKLPFSEINMAIFAMDDEKLGSDQVSALSRECPSSGEFSLVKEFDGPKEKLGKTEQFVLSLSKVPCLKLRLSSWKIKNSFTPLLNFLEPSIENMQECATILRSNVKFLYFLRYVLSVGNYMNGGTRQGGAYGFSLSSLTKLSSIKGNNKRSLVYYIIRKIQEDDEKRTQESDKDSDPKDSKEDNKSKQTDNPLGLPKVSPSLSAFNGPVLSFVDDFECFMKCSKITMNGLKEDYRELEKSVKTVESALESVPKPSEQDSFDKFHEVMGSFHKQAVLSVSSVKEDLDTIEEDHRKTSEAFGEIPSKFPLDEMILMMIGFVNEIKSNIQQIAADKEKEKKIAKKKEEKKEEAEKAL
ncbi:hypothetical protein ADUPG1_013419, partial [Aduncisulcus paluster]